MHKYASSVDGKLAFFDCTKHAKERLLDINVLRGAAGYLVVTR